MTQEQGKQLVKIGRNSKSRVPEQIGWILERHEVTNHFYDEYLPYEFHLRMVVQIYKNFKELAIKEVCSDLVTPEVIELSCWGHDLIEDTRTNYNTVKEKLGEPVANIIYALTNEKGRNRAERGNDAYYKGITSVRGADFVKLCDRIANAQYSKMSGSGMYNKYKEENDDFLIKMNFDGLVYHPLWDMFSYLINLFK